MGQANSNEISQLNKQNQCKLKNIFLFPLLFIMMSVLAGTIVYSWQNKIFLKIKGSFQQQIIIITNELDKTKQINNELQQTINGLQSQLNKVNIILKEKSGPTTKMSSILSSDSNYEAYLEKEFNDEINRYVRQSVVMLNKVTGEQKILNEISLTSDEALRRYSEDGCNEDGVCCNSVIDFNEFKPISWITDDMILVEQYYDNYECAGIVPEKHVYNTSGHSYFNEDQVTQIDYKTAWGKNDGWYIANICDRGNNTLSLILQKTLTHGGYSYIEFDPQTKVFSNQMVEKEMLFGEKGMYDFLKDCDNITNEEKIRKYFIEK